MRFAPLFNVRAIAGDPCAMSMPRADEVPASHVYRRSLSVGDEPALCPAYQVYFSGCNLRCRFCVQAPTCFNPRAGEPVDTQSLADACVAAVQRGARSIMWLGGEPGLHTETIRRTTRVVHTALSGRSMPNHRRPTWALKTNLYLGDIQLDGLSGVIDAYVVDHKFGSDRCAARLASVTRYRQTVEQNMLRLHRSGSRLFIRHLLMPGHIDCCLGPVARWVAEHLPGVPFWLMTGYTPAYRTDTACGEAVRRDPCVAPLYRHCTPSEIRDAEGIVAELGLSSPWDEPHATIASRERAVDV